MPDVTVSPSGIRQDVGTIVTPDTLTFPAPIDYDQGSHYDYARQTWVDGQDHAHIYADGVKFCGSDIVTCTGVAS